MSSYASIYALEEYVKERIRFETNESIQSLTEQLKIKNDKSQYAFMTHVSQIVIAEDDLVHEKEDNYLVSENDNLSGSKAAKKRDVLNLSSLLNSSSRKSNRLQRELDFLIKSVEKRMIITEEDENARKEITRKINQIISDSSLDVEDKISILEGSVNRYLAEAVSPTIEEIERQKTIYNEYLTLCNMLDIKPTEHTPYQVKKEHKRLSELIIKKRENEYVMNVIVSIMEELGCKTENDKILFGVVGQVFSVNNEPMCNVFTGMDDNQGILFEPIEKNIANTASANVSQLQNNVEHICALYEKIEQMAAYKGVILKREYMTSAASADIMKRNSGKQVDVLESQSRRRKKTVPLQMKFNPENKL